MEEIEFPLILSSDFYTYVLCQNIFALRYNSEVSNTLCPHHTSAYVSILFSLHSQYSRSNKQSFYLELPEKIPIFFIRYHCDIYLHECECVCTTYVCMSCISLCLCVIVHACAYSLPSPWNNQHFHCAVQWLRNMLVLTSWYSKSTTIPACFNCLFLSHCASKGRIARKKKEENGVDEPYCLKASNPLTHKYLLKNLQGFCISLFITSWYLFLHQNRRICTYSQLFSVVVILVSLWRSLIPHPQWDSSGMHLLSTKTRGVEVKTGAELERGKTGNIFSSAMC